jgi:hypothetical protein
LSTRGPSGPFLLDALSVAAHPGPEFFGSWAEWRCWTGQVNFQIARWFSIIAPALTCARLWLEALAERVWTAAQIFLAVKQGYYRTLLISELHVSLYQNSRLAEGSSHRPVRQRYLPDLDLIHGVARICVSSDYRQSFAFFLTCSHASKCDKRKPSSRVLVIDCLLGHMILMTTLPLALPRST